MWIPVLFMFMLRFCGALSSLFWSTSQSSFYMINGLISCYFIISGLWRMGRSVATATTSFVSRVTTRVRRFYAPSCRYRRTGSCQPIIKRFRRRHLHYCLVRHCRHRLWDASLLGPRIQQHRRWRRIKARWIKRDKVKRRNAFL
jgi:hypothetical protein